MAANSRRESGTDPPPPLVEAKLAVPSVRRAMVDRPRVRRALDAGREASLTLVAAPAGYGKTTAVRDWCASLDAALAWVVLDAGDNDPALLWRYVATAVDRVRPGLGRGALRRLGVAGSPVEAAVDELLNGVAALGTELVIVLDDLHAVTSQECLASIDYALAHLPPNTHVVLVTRVDPALRLARLRAAGDLAEVRAADLAFTTAEAHELLVGLGHLDVGRGGDRRARRAHRGLARRPRSRLAVAADRRRSGAGRARLRRRQPLRGRLPEQRGSRGARRGRPRVPPRRRGPRRVHRGALRRRVRPYAIRRLGSPSSSTRTSSSRGWSEEAGFASTRCSPNTRGLSSPRSEPGAPMRIHRRAAEWLRSRGLPVEAVDHAAAAGDHELVAQLLVEYHLPLIRGGASRTLLRWVRTLPDDRIVEHPELAVAAATATVLVGGSTIEQRRLLQLADAARGERPEPRRLRRDGGAAGARAHDRRRRRSGGARRPACGRARGGRCGRDPHGSAGRLRPRPLLRRRARRGVGGGGADPRASGHRAARPEPGGRPLDARPRRGSSVDGWSPHEATPRRRRPRWAGSARAGAGSGPTRPPLSARCWLPREASSRRSSELASAERFFRDEVATLHHAWLLVLLARVRLRRGRLDEAEQTLRSAREALGELVDSGLVPALAERGGARARGGDEAARPAGRCSSRRARPSSPCCGSWPPTCRRVRSASASSSPPNTIRSHRRALYHKLGVHSRADAIARATALGLLGQTESPG